MPRYSVATPGYKDGVLVFQDTVVEYGFLPLGSALPDPAAEAWASGRLPIPTPW